MFFYNKERIAHPYWTYDAEKNVALMYSIAYKLRLTYMNFNKITYWILGIYFFINLL